MVFREQIIIFSQPGMLPESAFVDLIGKIQDLDMDQVRKDIAEENSQE